MVTNRSITKLNPSLLALVFALCAPLAMPSEVWASSVIRHTPLSEAAPGAPLEILVFSDSPEGMAHLRLHYRLQGRMEFSSLEFSRLETGAFVADIPASDVRSPGIEYFLAAREGALRGPRFASAATPHLVRVVRQSEEQKREDRLALYDGRRSRFSGGAYYVNYGPVSSSPTPPEARRAVEDYYVFTLDFTYRVLTTLHSLRFGAVWLRGHSITGGEPLEPPSSVGYDYGFSEVWFELRENIGLVAELQLGANAEMFTFGAKGGLRIGRDPGTNLLIWGGGTYLVGGTGGLKLQWNTVPYVPMAVSIVVTSWPDARVGGLRLVYEAVVPTPVPGLHVIPEISYQARSARFGRVGGGLRGSYSF